MSAASRCLLAALFFTAGAATAPQPEKVDLYQDRLYNGCRPMLFRVNHSTNETSSNKELRELIEENSDLSEKVLRSRVTQRLQIAGLHTESHDESKGATLALQIEVDYLKATLVRFWFLRMLTDEYGKSYLAPVWEEKLYIPVPNARQFSRVMVSDMLDDFLELYLVVNMRACNG